MSEDFELVVGHLSKSLELLASSASGQVNYLHKSERFVLPVEELAHEYEHWMQSYFSLGGTVATSTLQKIDSVFEKFSGTENVEHWSEKALSSDLMWEEIRALAVTALKELVDLSDKSSRSVPG